MGRRQRHSEFIGLSPEEVERLAKDKRTPPAVRLKALAELKYGGVRNRQKEVEMSELASYTRPMDYVYPDHLVEDLVPRRRPRYRWRTWIRGHVPWALVRFFPQGLDDCGKHRWHAGDDDTDRCYHCVVGVRPRQLFPPDEMRRRERAAQ